MTSYFLSKIKYKKGFSLIELLIYSAILVVVLFFTSEYLYSLGQARLNNTARVEVTQAAQLIINKLKVDIPLASAINVPSGSDPSSNLGFSIAGDSIDYSVSGSALYRTLNGVGDKLTSNQVSISNLEFRKIANPGGINTVQIKFTLTSLAQLSGGRNVQESFQTTISQR